MKKSKFNHIAVGLIAGIITPIITLIVVYYSTFKSQGYTPSEFWDFLILMNVIGKLLSLCVVPNLGIFFLFIWRNLLLSARGVLAATFIIAISIIIYKFAV
jgi:uncharacterized membrane-anchored protein